MNHPSARKSGRIRSKKPVISRREPISSVPNVLFAVYGGWWGAFPRGTGGVEGSVPSSCVPQVPSCFCFTGTAGHREGIFGRDCQYHLSIPLLSPHSGPQNQQKALCFVGKARMGVPVAHITVRRRCFIGAFNCNGLKSLFFLTPLFCHFSTVLLILEEN